MDFKFFNKDGGYTYLDVNSDTYREEAIQLKEQGYVEQAAIITADTAKEAEAIYKNEYRGFFQKLNMLLGPFITLGYHRSK